MYSLLLFLVIVWLTEMVISINQGIFFFQERGLGRGDWGRELRMVESKEKVTVCSGHHGR